MDTIPLTDLYAFLAWAVHALPSIVAVLFASWAMRKWPWFREQDNEIKVLIALGVSVVVALVPQLILTFVPADVLAALSPWFALIASTVVSVLGGQLWHIFVNKKDGTSTDDKLLGVPPHV